MSARKCSVFTSPVRTECGMFVLYAVLYGSVNCCVVRGCAVSIRYVNVCHSDVFSVVNMYLDYLKLCAVCINRRMYVCCSLLLLVSLHHTFVIHCFTHLCAVSLYISRSSVVHACGRSGQFSKCSIVCGSSVQSHVVSSSQYPHLFISAVVNVMFSLTSVMSPPPELCDISVRMVGGKDVYFGILHYV